MVVGHKTNNGEECRIYFLAKSVFPPLLGVVTNKFSAFGCWFLPLLVLSSTNSLPMVVGHKTNNGKISASDFFKSKNKVDK